MGAGPPSPSPTPSWARRCGPNLQFHVHEPAVYVVPSLAAGVTWPTARRRVRRCAAPDPVPRGGLGVEQARRRSGSSRSQFHVHSQTWRPPAPGCWRSLPSTTTERFVSSPLGGGRNRVTGRRGRGARVALSAATAPDVPGLSTRIETFVFWTPLCVAVGARSVGAGGVRSGDGVVALAHRAVVSGREHADRDVRVAWRRPVSATATALSSTVLSPFVGGRDRRRRGARRRCWPARPPRCRRGCRRGRSRPCSARLSASAVASAARRLVARGGRRASRRPRRLGVGLRLVLLRDRRAVPRLVDLDADRLLPTPSWCAALLRSPSARPSRPARCRSRPPRPSLAGSERSRAPVSGAEAVLVAAAVRLRSGPSCPSAGLGRRRDRPARPGRLARPAALDPAAWERRSPAGRRVACGRVAGP